MEMKYKTLVIREGTKYQTFAVYQIEVDEFWECSTPDLLPMTATMEALKKFYKNTDLTDITMVTVELEIIKDNTDDGTCCDCGKPRDWVAGEPSRFRCANCLEDYLEK